MSMDIIRRGLSLNAMVGGAAIAALLATGAAPASAQGNPPLPCSEDPLFDQFDYILGTWDVFRDGIKTAQVHWEKDLYGCAITERWVSVNPERGNGLGLMTYSRLRGSPTYYWVSDTGGNTVYTIAEVKPNNITFLTEAPHPSGHGIRARRFQLMLQEDGSVLEYSMASDNGGPYVPEFELVWRRPPAP